jgi:demethylmenaquinone methyltransferase/2-methoxy-6-polyprenyl-1,4-benzoquinol methylase
VVLSELKRVVRPGGSLVICEFSTPTSPVVRFLHRQWMNTALPLVSRVASNNAPAYSYLNDSIKAWPDQRGLAAMMENAGWNDIQWRNLTGGIVTLHRATRP